MPFVCTQSSCPDHQSGYVSYDDNQKYCRTCGNLLQPQSGAEGAINPVPGGTAGSRPAPKLKRISAYIVDVLISALPMLIASVLGTLAGLISVLFWLFRDIGGASPGKTLFGLQVTNNSGGHSTQLQRMLRNLPLAAPLIPLLIPLGATVAYPLDLALSTIEAALVIFFNWRIGDRIANTSVTIRT